MHGYIFADDCLLYRRINTQADADSLQNDLSSPQRWEQLWQMEFHPQKCTVIHVTNKRRPLRSTYTPHGHILKEVSSAKYLGVTIHNKLKWNEHMSNIRTKPIRPLASSRGTYMDASLPSSPWPTRQWSALPWSTLAPCGTPTSRSTSEHLRVPRELPGL